ncbi:DCL family protein [Pedobacter panaciterrae]|uniref:DCL family protein n=1 Tax=Pedobacter panaciterrae TaxID=363849 RepID=A0ABU8NS15_9SPHI
MNKSQLKERAKAILNNYPLGHIFDSTGLDYKFLIRIFEGHPEYNIKSGLGISEIYIGQGETYKTRCFFVKRVDGTNTDISYLRSVDGASSKISDIKAACRSAIKFVIDDVGLSVNYGIDSCLFTGEILTKENTHIDHYDKPFDEVVNEWIKHLNIDSVHSCINDGTKDNEFDVFFTSRELNEDFVLYHNRNTNLRAISKKANLSLLKKQRI